MSRIALPPGHIPEAVLSALDEVLVDHGCTPVSRRDRIRNFILVPTDMAESIVSSFQQKVAAVA